MRNSDYYLPAIALGIAFIAKLPALRRGWRDPLVRSVNFLVFTAAICFFFAAPPTITAVNDLTGIPNFSGPLVYCIMCAFSAACLVLIVNWRGGPPEGVARSSRRWLTGYGIAIAALPIFFLLGDAPVERLRDLDTYYASTPFIREMIVTYLGAHLVSALVTTSLCARWARHVTGWLRLGLGVLIVGFVFNLAFSITKLSAVVARWFDTDWDTLSTNIAPPIAAAGGLIVTVGFLTPLVGPRISEPLAAWITYWRLGPLWRRLRPAPGDRIVMQLPWWSAPDIRLTVRETGIHDELLRLRPYLDDAVRQRTVDSAIATGIPSDRANLAGTAAMVAVAAKARAASPNSVEEHTEQTLAAADALTATLASGRERLVQLSRALHSPVVTAAQLQAAPTESSTR
ncbi:MULTISPECIES: MAB_1171c family putative transporter [unclassified Streptomyces]|uniref:MAB_1171c family putative transporter n=1 Tax=unclassified Streptomyces TaxID=2593676 RepID=UPI0028C38AF1|nr:MULTISPECIES: MAB_1171c family putative transporter [unclassified Streptomyces]WNO76783.1 MAB_1171c family putative transporter [Streptomyces sp. AM8-1-1]